MPTLPRINSGLAHLQANQWLYSRKYLDGTLRELLSEAIRGNELSRQARYSSNEVLVNDRSPEGIQR